MTHHRPIVLVTGATGIIGPSIVETLTRKNWRVAASDLSEADRELCERLTGKNLVAERFIPADLSTRAGAEALMREVREKMGPVSAIVNGAVVNHGMRFAELDETAAQREIAVNFLAPLWLARAALEDLRANRGSIVHFSSIRTVQPRRTTLLYSCMKVALEQATAMLAGELAEEGVRVNAIRVGSVPGNHYLRAAARALPPDQALRMAEELLPRHFQRLRESLGVHCVVAPEEIARWVARLIDPGNSALNGEIITLDGGYTRQMPEGSAGTESARELAAWLESHAAQKPAAPTGRPENPSLP